MRWNASAAGAARRTLILPPNNVRTIPPFHGTLVRPVQSLEQRITADAPRLLIGREIRALGFQRVRLAHGVLNIRVFQQFRMAFHFPVIIEETSAVLGEEPHMPRVVGFRARDESGVGFLQTFKIQFEIAGTGRDGPEQAAEAEDPEKKYEVVYLDMSKEEKAGAQEKLTGLMEDCRAIYAGAEKGSADDVSLAEDGGA